MVLFRKIFSPQYRREWGWVGKGLDRTFPSGYFFLLPNTFDLIKGMGSPRKTGVHRVGGTALVHVGQDGDNRRV